MQSNVIKKSWTTSNISKAIDTDTGNWREETEPFQSRDLIREFLLKTRVPEILKPQQFRRHSATFPTSAMSSEVNFAYKHPLVIAEELKSDSGEAMADQKLCNAVDNSSIIIPKAVKHPKKSSPSDRPHLIGKVTPSIAKTWEQLSSAMDRSMESNAEEDDKQSYVLFMRRPFNFQSSDDDGFAVNKIQHDSSENFFDSINRTTDDNDEENCLESGEVMADDLDSLEMRCNDVILWSIES